MAKRQTYTFDNEADATHYSQQIGNRPDISASHPIKLSNGTWRVVVTEWALD